MCIATDELKRAKQNFGWLPFSPTICSYRIVKKVVAKEIAMQFQYNDGLCDGNRFPRLWIVCRGQIHNFSRENIPGVVVVTASHYEKRGKWSNTTFDLALAEGAIPCRLLAPLHGKVWPENERMAAYERFMEEFKVTLSFDAFDVALLRDYPKARTRMIKGEEALESLDPAGSGGSELMEITVSKPNNRTPHRDVRVTTADGQSWVIACEAEKGVEIPGVCKLVDTRHTPGHRGGSTTLVLSIADGVSVAPEMYPKDGTDYPWALGRGGNGQKPSSEAGGFTILGDALREAGLS